MKREKLNTLSERDLIIGMITSDRFCREIAPVLNPRQLEVDYSRIIAGWVKEYYFNFKVAPKKDIMKIYRAHCEEITDESLQDNVLYFIEKINKDYEKIKNINDDYVLENSIKYLKSRSLQNLSDDVSAYLSSGDIKKAENAIVKYKTVEKSSGSAVSLLHNTESVTNSFTAEDDLLFQFPGAYGSVVGKIHREDFISYLAPMKRGKTWALMDAGITAIQNGLKVYHVSLEMSESQMIKRYWTCLTGQLSEDKEEIKYPYFEQDDDKWIVKTKVISRKAVSVSDIESKQKSLRRLFRGGDIRILAVPAYSYSVEMVDDELEKIKDMEGYIPDVIIIDYADIMAPSERGEYRNQLDGIWKRLRGLAQKRKAVVFTASQSGRASIGKDANEQDISEDIRKLAHVTSMVSLNQSKSEKENGILRLKQLALREGDPEFRQAVCTQCLAIGRIVMDSHFDNECNIELENSNDDEPVTRRKRK